MPAPLILPTRERLIEKLCGADFELGASLHGPNLPARTGQIAALLVLREISGLPLARRNMTFCYCRPCVARRQALNYGYVIDAAMNEDCERTKFGSDYNAQDYARRFLPSNAGCFYDDMGHPEACIPEVRSARDHVAATHAMLALAREAAQKAGARLPAGVKLVVLANNSDGQGNSYGSHLNFLITREARDGLFDRRLHHLLFLAAHQVSSLIFTGQGKAGSENGRPPVDFQISQRADFFEVLVAQQTTWNRPVVNSRDEALCGPDYGVNACADAADKARLHVIFYDQSLCHTAHFLKVGVMQIILAMIEAGEVRGDLALDDPVAAVVAWSHDPDLQAKARLVSGRLVRAVELQEMFLEEAQAFVAAGHCEGIVPEAAFIIELWADTLAKLRARDFTALARRLDWVLKRQLIERALANRPGLDWTSPQAKHLDLMYASLEGGLYDACERGGAVDLLATPERIEHLRLEPPEDTRAWTRAMLLRLAQPEEVDRVDWDSMTFTPAGGGWSRQRTVRLTNPLGFTRAACGRALASSANLEEALEILGAGTDTGALSVSAAGVSSNPNDTGGNQHEPTRTN
jgi:proteasome accessory factor A